MRTGTSTCTVCSTSLLLHFLYTKIGLLDSRNKTINVHSLTSSLNAFLLTKLNFDVKSFMSVYEVIFVVNKTYIYCDSNDMPIMNFCL